MGKMVCVVLVGFFVWWLYIMETTKWSDNTPNHLYLVNDADRVVAYSIHGTETPFYFSRPLPFDVRGRTFKEVKTHPFTVEETDKIVEVAGSKGAVYKVNLTKNTCTCSAFKFGKKGTCKHLEELKGAK